MEVDVEWIRMIKPSNWAGQTVTSAALCFDLPLPGHSCQEDVVEGYPATPCPSLSTVLCILREASATECWGGREPAFWMSRLRSFRPWSRGAAPESEYIQIEVNFAKNVQEILYYTKSSAEEK